MHGQKLQSWDLVISVTYFILSQEIVFLLWLLPSEELWISRGYEVCAAATMEPDGPQAGIFHLGFSLQGMIFPGMRHNPWAKVCDSNCIYVSALSRVSEMGAEVLPKQENLSVLHTVGSKALQYQANMKMVLNKKNQITLFATSVSNLQFRQWSHICQSNLLLLKQHSLTYTHDMFGLFSSIFLYLIFFSPLFFSPYSYQWVFQCKLHPWSWCCCSSAVCSLPRTKIICQRQEPLLWDQQQRTLLWFWWGLQVNCLFWTCIEFTFGEKELVRREKADDMLMGCHLSSFRCLKDGVADVAFLDHLAIMEATGILKNSDSF